MLHNAFALWAICQTQQAKLTAALEAGHLRPTLAGYPEVPVMQTLAADWTAEGYYSDRLTMQIGKGQVVVVPIYGTMSRNYNWDNYFSNDFLVKLLDAIALNETKKGVILDFNSGGGTVDSTDELAAAVTRLAQVKPVVSLVNFCASAAYWVGSQANEVMMRPGPVAQVGSIGTLLVYQDIAKALEKAGIDIQIFRSTGSVDKARINGIEPLTDELKAQIQQSLDTCNKAFKGAVRTGRGAKLTSEEIFTGKLYGAQESRKLGLTDTVGDQLAAYNRVLTLSKSYA